jgi:hypothetical protein
MSQVYDDMKNEDWAVPFMIILHLIIRAQWYGLAVKLNEIYFADDKDIPIWKWTVNKFYVKSVYMELTKRKNEQGYREIWKARIPEKVKFFMSR